MKKNLWSTCRYKNIFLDSMAGVKISLLMLMRYGVIYQGSVEDSKFGV